jgi:hypothetical protein
MGVGGWLLMALLWGAFLAVVIWAVARLFPRNRAGTGGGDAASQLDRRLAAGKSTRTPTAACAENSREQDD